MTAQVVALTAGHAADDIGRCVKEAFFMFYATFWAIILGFTLSGAVQAFASRAAMQRRLGDHRPEAIGRATFYGMISSSCSYAASAMAKSLFQKGADFTASMVFMVASTNLVVELGIVLVVLIGWQFVAAEFIGGAIMVALLGLTGGLWFRGRSLDEARRRTAIDVADDQRADVERPSTAKRMASFAGWSDASSYAIADLLMLRRELVIGFGVAGAIAVLVPVHLWDDLFLHGHGLWTTLENVIVGPFIALISCVCSIGNVPLAAALWRGGISFGGVVSFIFADLIALPLLFIYRKLYGTAMAARILLAFWAAMSLAGLATEGIFRAVGWVPTSRPIQVVTERFSWDWTAILDLAFLGVFTAVYLLHRNRARFGGGLGYATDPVCGMQVEIANAPASYVHDGERVYFCSDHCRERFAPARVSDKAQ